MEFTQTESGYRNEGHTEYKGHKVRVVSAYDGRSDRWYIHVYVAKPGLPEMKAHSLDGAYADDPSEGLAYGFSQAKSLIDQTGIGAGMM